MDHKYHVINYGSINSFPCKNYSIIYVRNFNHFAEKIEEGAKFMPYKGRMSRMCRQLYKIENFMCESGGRTPKLTKDSPTNSVLSVVLLLAAKMSAEIVLWPRVKVTVYAGQK